MSVLVKGMEMPKSCDECRFFVDAWCYAFKADDWRNAYNKPPKGERLDNCPLVPVPPHGDLIDADALKLSHCVECTLYPNECLGEDCDWDSIYHIEHAPTIIEAEEGET